MLNRLAGFFAVVCILFSLVRAVFAQDLETAPNNDDDGSEAFVERTDTKTIVIWKDVQVPPNRYFDTIVVMDGNVDFGGVAENLIVVAGKVRCERGSEVRERFVVIRGQVEQLPGAKLPQIRSSGIWGSLKSWAQDHLQFDSSHIHFSKWVWFPLFAWTPIALLLLFCFAFSFLFFWSAPQLTLKAQNFLMHDLLVTFAWGAVAYFAFLPILVLLILTVIGILATPFFLIFWLYILIGGFLCVCRSLGLVLLRKKPFAPTTMATLIGLGIFLAAIFLPGVFHILFIAAFIAGAGAMLRAFFDRHHPSFS